MYDFLVEVTVRVTKDVSVTVSIAFAGSITRISHTFKQGIVTLIHSSLTV